jgi:hypothetical protein
MIEIDKIVAAILTVSLCIGRNFDKTEYLDTYDELLDELKLREKAKRKPVVIRAKMKRKPR